MYPHRASLMNYSIMPWEKGSLLEMASVRLVISATEARAHWYDNKANQSSSIFRTTKNKVANSIFRFICTQQKGAKRSIEVLFLLVEKEKESRDPSPEKKIKHSTFIYSDMRLP